jgi:hypothetical protein
MKRALAALLLVASSGTAANAVQVNSVITDSVQLTVEGAAVQTRRIGTTYSASGTNVSASTLGGLSGGTATAAPTITAGSYSVTNAGDAFTFTETATIGDTPVTVQATASNNGRFNAPVLYGDSTTSMGGTAGDLAGQIGGNHGGTIPQVTAGGPGTTAIAQRTVELSVFR